VTKARRPGTDLDALGATVGHVFRSPVLLLTALTHAGAARNRDRANERLEFLGDRVLGLVIADALLARFPGESEGALAKRLASLASRDTLAAVAGASPSTVTVMVKVRRCAGPVVPTVL